ncbi:undecaprenyl-diphosphatase UppP [Phaeocystidibacter marisrubri]|uniref:Undecaprenyl-diphosphatase n=1 Tax=Phaeocystidibacter marisrubri TaxID=1577780 RepID=A0A6L3ZFR7_9FLAO|nr:undecaprenyl-diphosphatase UppP [Phaeocystidibacter marisrubri]KAB2816886.1 undecaprenyl-diphosphatase UppP [Phaeocystidibacter marisrubri]GGH77729.1 undecaprenyl-diphosphatase [Phaeocystidibacter marisrubri]
MNLIEAIVLGIVQGLTEFLPVSSSGHLEIVKVLFNGKTVPEESMFMTVVLHAATALATVVIYRKDIVDIFKGLLKFKWNDETKFASFIVISMIPAALVGILLEDQIESLFSKQLTLVGAMLIVTSLLLVLADRAKKTHKKVSAFEAAVIGVSQAIAILPGISRSGATISTSVLLGIDRDKAARFSFLMVIPLILGKMILDLKDIFSGEVATQPQTAPLLAGFIAAFVVGLFACRLMIRLVKKAKLTSFAIYCFIVGLIAVGSTFYNAM